MRLPVKVNKKLSKEQVELILSWDYLLLNQESWEYIQPEVKEEKYKFTISHKKEFMKFWIDRKLNLAVTKELRDTDLAFLYRIFPYVDKWWTVNFGAFKKDNKFTDSKLSKARKVLIEKGLIKKSGSIWYINPILWIQWDEASQELIDLFYKEIEKYWAEINYSKETTK